MGGWRDEDTSSRIQRAGGSDSLCGVALIDAALFGNWLSALTGFSQSYTIVVSMDIMSQRHWVGHKSLSRSERQAPTRADLRYFS